MSDILDIDRVSLGWQPFLPPRQTRVILARLNWKRLNAEDKDELAKLKEWFGHEAKTKTHRLQES